MSEILPDGPILDEVQSVYLDAIPPGRKGLDELRRAWALWLAFSSGAPYQGIAKLAAEMDAYLKASTPTAQLTAIQGGKAQ